MSKCPHCHSAHITRIQYQAAGDVILQNSISPMALAKLGMEVATRLKVHPLIGGVAGLLLGGGALLYVNHKNKHSKSLYHCEQCQHEFELED